MGYVGDGTYTIEHLTEKLWGLATLTWWWLVKPWRHRRVHSGGRGVAVVSICWTPVPLCLSHICCCRHTVLQSVVCGCNFYQLYGLDSCGRFVHKCYGNRMAIMNIMKSNKLQGHIRLPDGCCVASIRPPYGHHTLVVVVFLFHSQHRQDVAPCNSSYNSWGDHTATVQWPYDNCMEMVR